jgi:hypothetical protein
LFLWVERVLAGMRNIAASAKRVELAAVITMVFEYWEGRVWILFYASSTVVKLRKKFMLPKGTIM